VPGRGRLRVTASIPHEFRMATPLPLGMVIWFGSLEFMSLGHAYDMVLLPPRAPSNNNSSPCCQKRGRQLGHHGHHSHRACRMQWVRKNHRPCSGTEGDSPSSTKSSCMTARIGSLARDMPGMHLATRKASLAQGASVGRCFGGPSRFVGSASETGGPTAAPSLFPYGLTMLPRVNPARCAPP
jgi:hypothetical protein